jgi:teichoic acid transport system permease protein
MADVGERQDGGALLTGDRRVAGAAELAAAHGLSDSTARPTLRRYVVRLWQRRHFIVKYATARSTAEYSASQLGQIWQLLTPLLSVAVYFFIFGLLLGTNRGVTNFLGFLVIGVFTFTFTRNSLSNGVRSINGNLGIIRALNFPRAVLPFSSVLVELRQLLFSIVLLFPIIPLTAFINGTDDVITWHWLLLIPAVALQTLFNLGIGLTIARIAAFQPDVNQLMPFISRLWFYGSGVIFSIQEFGSHLPGALYDVLELNPGAIYLDLYRAVLLTSYKPFDLPLGLSAWTVGAAWAVVFFAGGFVFFWRREEAYGRG